MSAAELRSPCDWLIFANFTVPCQSVSLGWRDFVTHKRRQKTVASATRKDRGDPGEMFVLLSALSQ